MRPRSAHLLTVLRSYPMEVCLLVKIGSGASVILLTSHSHDVVYGGETYLAENDLKGIDPPRQSTIVDREMFKIQFADPTFIHRPRVMSGMTGASVKVYAAFYNTTGAVLGPYLPDEPMLGDSEIQVAYAGVIDAAQYEIEEEIILTFECSSPIAALGLVKGYHTSKDHAMRFSPGDTSYDDVYAGSKSIDLLWGRSR